MSVRDALANGAWRAWLFGIVGTLAVAAITNGIVFQRETREHLAKHEERIKAIETRARDAIIREFQRHDDMSKRLEHLIERIDKR